MKLKGLVFALLVFGLSSVSHAKLTSPIITKVPVVGIYSPSGFDSNDNVEVIVEGYLPNLCYKTPIIKTEIINNKIDIRVEAYRANQKGIVCLEMIVPFVERVSLGILKKGKYDISVNKLMKSSIEIIKTNGPLIDEHIYANVHRVERIKDTRRVILRGYNPSDCLELDKIVLVSNKIDVYSVLPRMKKVSDFCPVKMVPFAYEVEIPNDLLADKILLHIRAMDGRSVNLLFYNFMDEVIQI